VIKTANAQAKNIATLLKTAQQKVSINSNLSQT